VARRFAWAGVCGLLLAVVPGAEAGDKYFTSNGVKIRYTDRGKGEPVLLIHGFGVNLDLQWGVPGIIQALARDHRVIAYDCRGHGKSGKPHDPKKYGQEMVEDAVRLLDHLKIKKAHVVGYSMGAMITAKLLVTHPDRLRTATLGGGGAASQDEQVLRLHNQLAESLDQGKGIGPLIEALTPPGRPKPPPEQVQVINKLFTAGFNDTKALAAVVRGWKDLAVTDAELKANRVPVLALLGADDPFQKGVDALKGRLTDLQVVVIPQADHMTAFTRPEFQRALRAFLTRHAGSGGRAKRPAAAPAGGSR
jgi:pimeloyl-ACP methyl ester carboxylesterase